MSRGWIVALLALLSLAPGRAMAQPSVPDEPLRFPERARALRPTGRASHGVAWDAQYQGPIAIPGGGTSSGTGSQLVTHTVDVALPLDAAGNETPAPGSALEAEGPQATY